MVVGPPDERRADVIADRREECALGSAGDCTEAELAVFTLGREMELELLLGGAARSCP